jgi:Fe-S-cluster-containing dehydrogenase component/DMSO reductase anchor subunit
MNAPLPTPSTDDSADFHETRTLIDSLLADQRTLTAVEKFSRAHDRCEVTTPRYRDLIPLSAPRPGHQYAFEVDLDKCSGCKACVTACHSLNGLDDDETWRSVGALHSTDWRKPLKQIVTTACHHCVDPGCLNGCPVLAYDKDPLTGIVRHLDDQCIGCQYCVLMCPYEVPQYLPERGIVRKCDLCSSRLTSGEAPACVQACPNEAIRITVVEQAKVRGKYRQLSTLNPQRSTSSPEANAFLPDSPNPAITLPTTRYITRRPLPAGLEADDAHELRPAKAHPPLTLMLVLSQLGVGLALLDSVAGGTSRPTALAAWIIAALGVGTGTLHLGRPLKAWRSFLGWRKSWLSRELIAFAAFLVALGTHLVLLRPLSASLAALFGLTAVACSAMIYVDTRRPFWIAPMTLGKFLGTTLLLGGSGALLIGTLAATTTSRVVALVAVVLGTIAKLAVENRIFRFLVDEQDPHLSALNKTALLLAGPFGLASRVRVLCAMAGGVVLPWLAFISGTAGFALPVASLSLCLAGELIERHLFFVAEAAPKMPGSGAA